MTQKSYYYSVVQYLQDPIKNEPLNIGVILQSPKNNFVTCRFLKNVRNKLGSVPSLDIDIVKDYIGNFKSEFKPFNDDKSDLFIQDIKCLKEDFLLSLAKKDYGKIQFTDPRGGFSEDLKNEVNVMFNTFIGEEKIEKNIPQSRFKTQLHKEFNKRKWLLKQMKSGSKVGIEIDKKIDSSKSGANHIVDFSLQNGKLWLIETLDMSRDHKTVESETYKAAFKIDDLSSGKENIKGVSVISDFQDKRREYKNYLKILEAYSDVYVYSKLSEREALLKKLEELINH